ncbi:MAG: hypothetical protein DSZ35_06610 [Verrucomicrobia bacterium]|nr:MAG: hypothetical protein DSZ35_06610 [Verrucomicrobiota bacterium]
MALHRSPAVLFSAQEMNLQRLLLISIVANLVCLAGLFWMLADRQQPPAQLGSPVSAAATAGAGRAPGQAAPVERIVREVEPFHWSQIEADDYQTYVENLRRIGCPEETIRDLVKQDLDKLYDQRKADILSKAPAQKEYWKTGNPSALSRPSSATSSQMAQLDREKNEVLGDLFGSQGMAAINRPNPLARARSQAKSGYAMDFIPEETKAELNTLEREFGSELLKKMAQGATDAQDMAEIRQLRQNRDDRIATMLTPEQKMEYDLRKSPTAANMRLQMDGFDPSEDEFRDIFAARKAFDNEHGVVPGSSISPADAEVRQFAEQEMNNQISSSLGEGRYQDYMRQTDYDYKSIHKITQRQGLGENISAQVYQMKGGAEELAREIRMNTGLSIEERQIQLGQIQNETSISIQSLIGRQGAAALQTQAGGRNWLNNIGRVNPLPIVKPTFQVITSGTPNP